MVDSLMRAKCIFMNIAEPVSVVECFETVCGVIERRLSAHLVWSLSGFHLVLQSSFADGIAFDPFSLQQDGFPSPEVDIGGG